MRKLHFTVVLTGRFSALEASPLTSTVKDQIVLFRKCDAACDVLIREFIGQTSLPAHSGSCFIIRSLFPLFGRRTEA